MQFCLKIIMKEEALKVVKNVTSRFEQQSHRYNKNCTKMLVRRLLSDRLVLMKGIGPKNQSYFYSVVLEFFLCYSEVIDMSAFGPG